MSLSLRELQFIAQIKRYEVRKPLTHMPHCTNEHISRWLLARQMQRAFIIYGQLYFQRTAVDLKQLINTQRGRAFSSEPDADYR